jgi:Na+/H+ antiporter NhaC
MTTNNYLGGWSLTPLILFLVLFVGFGVVYVPAGETPMSPNVAIIPAIILGFLFRYKNVKENMNAFIAGVGHSNILTMCFIFLLSGAFSKVMLSVGGISSTVNFALTYIPSNFMLPGIFLVSSFISLAMGTSMGTVASMTPIAVGICETAGINLSIGIGAVIGGAMFGDNLSIISDTTIAAVQTQGCEMRDKFRMNLHIAIPAMLLTLFVLYLLSPNTISYEIHRPYDIVHILPYIAVLGLSLLGWHVYVILLVGIVLAGLIGFLTIPYSIFKFSAAIAQGFSSMQEILILSMLIGGLSELVKHHGGIRYLIDKILQFSHQFNRNDVPNKKVGELSISIMSSLADISTANNTVAILMAGEATHDIAKRYGIVNTRAASLLDIFSCVFQGILPYSAQVLLAGSIAHLAPTQLVGQVHYCYFLGISTLITIMWGLKQR